MTIRPNLADASNQATSSEGIDLESLRVEGVIPIIPSTAFDAHGDAITIINGDIWRFQLASQERQATINLGGGVFSETVKAHLIHIAATTSNRNALNTLMALRLLTRCQNSEALLMARGTTAFAREIKTSLLEISETLKKERVFHRFWRLQNYYRWGSIFMEQAGFEGAFVSTFLSMPVPGNPRGELVRTSDPIEGPLDEETELRAVTTILANEVTNDLEELQSTVLVALCACFGRYASCLIEIHQGDLVVEPSANAHEYRYSLRLPRVKKRAPPRQSLDTVPLEPTIGRLVQKLIAQNISREAESIDTTSTQASDIAAAFDGNDRPLFRRWTWRRDQSRWSWRSIDSGGVLNAIRSFADRHQLISPKTQKRLVLTARRFRYTVATILVRRGLSIHEAARVLDHSSVAYVRVYTKIDGSISKALAQAGGDFIEPLVSILQGASSLADHPAFVQFLSAADRPPLLEAPVPLYCLGCPAFRPYEHVSPAAVASALNDCLQDAGIQGAHAEAVTNSIMPFVSAWTSKRSRSK